LPRNESGRHALFREQPLSRAPSEVFMQAAPPPVPPLPKARPRGLNRLKGLRNLLVAIRRLWLVHVWGMDIHPTVQMSFSARFDRSFPIGVHVGECSWIAFDARILTHDRTRGLYLHTRIGRNCFVGGRSLILPGVEVGDNSIIAAGSVVTRSVPARSIVAGNPARVIRSEIEVGAYGRFLTADATEAALASAGLA
jgi:serine acetyltransferase